MRIDRTESLIYNKTAKAHKERNVFNKLMKKTKIQKGRPFLRNTPVLRKKTFTRQEARRAETPGGRRKIF